MTKDELVTVLGIAGVDPKTIEAMVQSYDMGFEHGAKVGEQMREALVEAACICTEYDAGHEFETTAFWAAFNPLKGMQ